ncbi:MAG: hypothetical protein HC897_11005 [Thermoanaerobaculia bacterium]|nr:hypothetical protein [Thermoanaerobaculia bacterium]
MGYIQNQHGSFGILSQISRARADLTELALCRALAVDGVTLDRPGLARLG